MKLSPNSRKTQTVTKNYPKPNNPTRSSKAMASITIRCGPAHKSRRPRPSNNSLAGYMPKFEKATHRQVARVKRTVPADNRFAALAIDTSSKVRCEQSFNGPRPSVAPVAQGSWGKKLAVNKAPVSNSRRVAIRIQQAKPQPPKEQKQGRPCAYCKELGHHIKHCPVLAAKNAKKAEWNRKNKARKAEEKRKAAEARLAEQFRLAQLAKEQAAEVVEEDSSDESSDDEDFPELRAAVAAGSVSTHRGEPKRRVTFKDDSENLMKPPCETKVFDKEQPATAISDEDEEEVILLKPSANAWKPKRLRQKTEQEEHDELLAIWRKDYEESSGSWADSADLMDDLATINVLRQNLGLPQLDEDGEEIVEQEITTDQFGRPSADNSAW